MSYSPGLCLAVPLPHGLLFSSRGNVVLLCSWEYSLMLSSDWIIRPPSVFGFVVLEGIKPSPVCSRLVIQLPCIPTPCTSLLSSSRLPSLLQLRFPSTVIPFTTASRRQMLMPTSSGPPVIVSCVASMVTDLKAAPTTLGSANSFAHCWRTLTVSNVRFVGILGIDDFCSSIRF